MTREVAEYCNSVVPVPPPTRVEEQEDVNGISFAGVVNLSGRGLARGRVSRCETTGRMRVHAVHSTMKDTKQ